MAVTFFSRYLNDTVTYWAPSSVAAGGWGDRTFARSVINGRWEQRVEQFTTAAGEVALSNAVVFLEDDVEPEGYLFLGTSTVTDPVTVSGAQAIRRFDKLPGLRSGDLIRQAFL